jgi:hypothetical protein
MALCYRERPPENERKVCTAGAGLLLLLLVGMVVVRLSSEFSLVQVQAWQRPELLIHIHELHAAVHSMGYPNHSITALNLDLHAFLQRTETQVNTISWAQQ